MQDVGKYRKKLIEIALPIDAINEASLREKSIRHGHPSTMHLWWARRPLATCRAVLFASLIDDPSEHPEQFPTSEAQDSERQRLFRLIEKSVDWKNVQDEELFEQIRAEIAKAMNGNPPPILDPFAGGGSIPLEAQRLGLESYASDLNPVAVLINKALIEIPPKFANRPPVSLQENLLFKSQNNDWKGAHGLAEDIRYYSEWMRDEAEKHIGRLYPKVVLPKEHGGGEATVIAWLWTRTAKCPNPACGIQMPLLSSFVLSSKKGEEAYLVPQMVNGKAEFTISDFPPENYSNPSKGLKRGISGIFECLSCKTVTTRDYISEEAKAKRLRVIQTAIVAQGQKKRIYLSAHLVPSILNLPEIDITGLDVDFAPNPRDLWCRNFGLTTPADLFSPRQLVALITFSDLVQEAHQRVLVDATAANLPDDTRPLHAGGCGALAYADAVATYLGMGVSRLSDICNTLCAWENTKTQVRHVFTRQVIPMLWDFAEPNVFANAAGDFRVSIGNLIKALETTPAKGRSVVKQQDATASEDSITQSIISTDPPYYDNVGYADLSDFFYVWLRRSLAGIYPELFRTVLVPKKQELVALPYRFDGDKKRAQEFFESGLGHAFRHMRAIQHPEYPLTVYYAFKQSESDANREYDNGEEVNIGKKEKAVVASTGWETMLEGLIRAGFEITGTWPMRTELMNRSVGQGTNALASSIVLVCRPRPADAPIATRVEFLRALRKELPEALRKLQHGSIAPVDLAQASIGPGMSIYSRYNQVVESDGTPLRVRTALQIINQELDASLREQEGEYDSQTRWAVDWFEQTGMQEALYGIAETLSKARNVSVSAMEKSRLVEAKAGKVRLRRRDELSEQRTASESSVWEVAQRMIYALLEGKGEHGGEVGAANILRQALSLSESVRDLTYRLYSVCERKGWAQEALAYNSLIASWTQILDLAHRKSAEIRQKMLL